MANQPEVSQWEAGIYQLETTDPVEAGPGGIDNLALLQLANRTKYLYDMMNALMAPFLGTTGDNGSGWVLFNDIVANIPAGWAEVTEMRGRTAIGMDTTDADFNAIGNAAGVKTRTLLSSNLPSFNIPTGPTAGTTDGGGALATGTANEGSLNLSFNNTPAAFSLMNPYRIVLYIKWVGLP